MLTPLVDIMFLLLIFFMLTSQTAPYSLISILAGQRGGTQAGPVVAPAAPASGEVVVSISHGFVRFNGEDVPMAGIRDAIARYRALGFERAAALTTRSATVQDVVTVLEAFETSDFGQLRLMMSKETP